MNFVYVGVLKLLSVLGFGFVAYEGFSALIDTFVNAVLQHWSGIGGNLLALINMAGFTDALGYSLSAITTKAALASTKRFLPK